MSDKASEAEVTKESLFKIDKRDESDDKDLTPDFLEKIERLSFNTIISSLDKPESIFKDLQEKRKSEQGAKRSELLKIYQKDLARYESQITDLKEQIENFESDLNTYKDRLVKLKQKATTVENKIDDLIEKYHQHQVSLGENKSSLITDRIEKIKRELDELNNIIDNVTKKKHQINKRIYEDNKDTLKLDVAFFQKFADHYEKVYKNIESELLGLSTLGITQTTSRFFMLLGISATGIAGWFFSVFSRQSTMQSDGWLFFIFESILKAGQFIFGDVVLASWQMVIVSLLSLVFALSFVTGVFWLCEELLEKRYNYKAEDNPEEFDIPADSYANQFGFIRAAKGQPNLKLWLTLLPYILIVGALYILLQVGVRGEDLQNLDKSLSGQVAGTTLALMIGGLGFAYLTYIIIPRRKKALENKEKEEGFTTQLIRNIEIISLLAIFILGLILMFLFDDQKVGSIIGFVVSSLFCGFLLGIGLRYKGLHRTRDVIESYLINIQRQITSKSGPIPLYMIRYENFLFRKKFWELQEELMNLLILQTQQVKSLWPGFFPNWLLRFNKRAKKIFDALSSKKGKKNPDVELIELTEIEEAQFPKQTAVIKELKRQIEEEKQTLEELTKKEKLIEEESSEFQRKKMKAIESLKQEIMVIEKHYVDRMSVHIEDTNKLREVEMLEDTALYEGYDLALWFLKYNKINTVS